MRWLAYALTICCFIPYKAISQTGFSIELVNQSKQPVAFAVGVTKDTIVFSNTLGEFHFSNKPEELSIYSFGYKPLELEPVSRIVQLDKTTLIPENADNILKKVIENEFENNPFKILSSFEFKRYNRTLVKRDSIAHKENNENLFSERISTYDVYNNNIKEYVNAQKNQGFEEPVLKILSHRMHGLNWYDPTYVIFENDFVSPVHKENLSAYTYHLFHSDSNFYYIKFSPNKHTKDRLLEGVMLIDKNYALAGIYVNKSDEVKLELYQSFTYNTTKQLWLTKQTEITMTPGKGGKPVSLFGTNIDIGKLQERSIAKEDINNALTSTSIFYDYNFHSLPKPVQDYDILVDEYAHRFGVNYWENRRKIPLTSKDSLFFKGIKETVERENTVQRIKRVQSFNKGFFPTLQWKTDLKTLIKLNNYEGFRLGIGGLTNEDFSESFRFGGYVAYGTKDRAIKYGLNTGLLLHKDTNTWVNLAYTDDVREVGSNAYLTDERVYSLFEPRLVNIIFFYKEKTSSLSIQKRISSDILSEFKVAHDRIFQTENYSFLNGDISLQSYDLTRAVLSVRWSPKSKFLKFNNKFVNYNERYPVFSGQIEQYLGQAFGGDLTFTKVNLEAQYVVNHINNNQTEVILEGNYAAGDVPLTHSYHAFPNAPNKDGVFQRFSVAGVKSFETMFFSEFFSTKLASLHIKHKLSPFKISNKFRPQLVLISRHAIGDFNNPERHLGINFNTLEKGFSEAGLELNKLIYGFGLSFAYRYGAYHLPKFEDNLAFKFTFNFEL
jgi:hypothetical protein